MYKKLIIILCMFLLTGCSTYSINKMEYNEVIDTIINESVKKPNINNKGYKYYLPTDFSVIKDNEHSQVLLSGKNKYYLNVDIVSYYYKNDIKSDREFDDYSFYTFTHNDTSGYLKIRKNNDNFFVELCYNYAIIEVEVKENELRSVISKSITILNSIKYNELVIKTYIEDNNIEANETVYKIPEPEEKDDSKNILQYIEEEELAAEEAANKESIE